MKSFGQLLVVAAALCAVVAPAGGQTVLSRNEIINSLQGAEHKAVLNPNDVRVQALEHIKKYPGDDAPTNAPMEIASQLEKLRQFVVEITFDFDSARIRPESYVTVGVIADALHTPYLQGQKFFIVGHTDASGKRSYNLDLSQRRAESVRQALITTFRVPAETVAAVGLGEEQLRDPSKPKAAINRRVQLINIGY